MAKISKANPIWRRSTHSASGSCVEVGAGVDVLVRDSRRPHGTPIAVPADAWLKFTAHLHRG